MSDRIQELTVFVRAADRGSFSRAARELGYSQPSVSRIVGELEARLGVKLLLRTTRAITLTDAGAEFLQRARQVLHELGEAEDAARGIDSLRGTIRMALPVTFGTRAIIPLLPAFVRKHQLLRIDLTVSDEWQNLIAEGVDLSIRLGRLENSGFGARRLATMKRFAVASPAYLKARGMPKKPAELAAHDCIFGPGATGHEAWSITRAGKSVSIDVQGRVRTNSGPAAIGCAVAGLGIVVASSIMCRDEIASGALVRVLSDYTFEPIDVHAVFPGGPRTSAKTRALVDHIAENLTIDRET